ncbi:MAG TPA: hypothetical protein VHG30_19140 [Microvirga sp.]|nr:hypothetical protein [Microvirga sp.]
MSEPKKPRKKDAGLENMSVNSARRSAGNGSARQNVGKDSTDSARAPDQQIPKR